MPAKLYQWSEWFGQPRVILRRGRDYFVTQSSFVQQLRMAASKRKLRIRVHDRGEEVMVEMLGKTKRRRLRSA